MAIRGTDRDKEGTTENVAWGTLEKLWLACAVNRYRANNWDSIARELQKQTSKQNLYNSQNCRLKFEELRRRFATSGVEEEVVLWTIEDELRKARLAELRRGIEQSDVSIRLLESTLKQLKEERGRSLMAGEEAKPEEVTDVVCDLDKQEPASNAAAAEEVSESKPEAEPEQDNKQRSEEQSQGIIKQRRTDGGDDGPEPIAASSEALQQRPLVRMLVLVRSQENSSFFESRLPSQETREYKDMVKQHMDLKTVESNMNQGLYLDSEGRFFRDLLVIFTNSAVFFPTNSPEYVAAEEIRKLVITEMPTRGLVAPEEPEAALSIAPDNTEANPLIICRRHSPAYLSEDPEAKSKDLHHDGKTEVVIAKKDMVRRGRPPLNRRDSRSSSSKVSHDEEIFEGKGKERRLEMSKRKANYRIRERNRIDISDDEDDKEDFKIRVTRGRLADNTSKDDDEEDKGFGKGGEEKRGSLKPDLDRRNVSKEGEESGTKRRREVATRSSKAYVKGNEERKATKAVNKTVNRQNISSAKKEEFQRTKKVEEERRGLKGDKNISRDIEGEEFGTRPKRDKAKIPKTSDHRKNLSKDGDQDGEVTIKLENEEKTSKAEAKTRHRSSTDNGEVEEVEEVKVKMRGRPPKKDVFRRMKVVIESSSEEDEVVKVKKRNKNHHQEAAGKEEPPQRREIREERRSNNDRRERGRETVKRGDSEQTRGGPRRRGRPRKSSLPPPIIRDSRVVVGRVKREPEEEVEDLPPPTKRTRR